MTASDRGAAPGRPPGWSPNLRSLSILGALVVDAWVGDGRVSWHPVAVAGGALERAYRPWRGRRPGVQMAGGAAALALVAAGSGAAAWAVDRISSRAGALRWLVLAAALKPTFAIRQLLEEGLGVASDLDGHRLAGARWRLRGLVSRDTGDLPPGLLASAAIESVAENLADSVTAPLLAFVMFGLPGAALYRVINTADAMFGYRGELDRLGKAAARTDDVLSWLPSRLSAVALAAAGGMLFGPAAGMRALASMRRDGGVTASPNAGLPIAAMAGVLGRRLEKRGHYVIGSSHQPPDARDVRRAVAVSGLAAALVGAALIVCGRMR